MTQTSDIIGERRWWHEKAVTAVAEVPGWVFVMPDLAGRPFSIAYAAWLELTSADSRQTPNWLTK
ncbi:MAG: hypothetical protein ACRYGR_09015 [Janthinobacterium lividum]